MKHTALLLTIAFLFVGLALNAQTAQTAVPGISVKGSVYGGGKNGQVYTKNASGDATDQNATRVTVNGGTVDVNVYGGGEQGDSKGAANVVVKGGTVTGSVFGGARMADVAGAGNVTIDGANVCQSIHIGSVYGGNDVSGELSGTATVQATKQTDFTKNIYISDLYGGGNGDYDYVTTYSGKSVPNLANAVINLKSGCYGRVFGGGNNATVTGSTSITLNNTSTALSDGTNALSYQFGSVFGGNNKVEMNIRPQWNLTAGSIENLYSGGNKGIMTYSNGLILELLSPSMTVRNVFGGCRIADVHPSQALAETLRPGETDEFTFPAGYGARVRVTAGKITNVYGGNDIGGDVYYGTNVIIENDIIGDVYGGGNGSYAYTTKDATSDLYFDKGTATTDVDILAKLNQHRPNSQNALIRITGKKANITYIGGSVYCGGNSATLRGLAGSLDDAFAKLELGSYVVANQVFLGSNGANMVTEQVMKDITTNIDGVDLTESDAMAEYMKGVEVSIRPSISILSDGFVAQSTYIGSFFCGGNVGSMTAADKFDISFLNSIVIFDKLVAGCNNANVAYREGINAFHQGGLTTAVTSGPKVNLSISGLKMEPKKLVYDAEHDQFNFSWNTYDAPYEGFLKGGNIYGGCYESGIVNGEVKIDVTKDIITSDTYKYFTDHASEGKGWDEHCFEPFVSALCLFGGGYGEQTEIWGNVSINIIDNARVLKVRGGGEMGWVGKMNRTDKGLLQIDKDAFKTYTAANTEVSYDKYKVSEAYSTIINLNANPIDKDGNVIEGTDMSKMVNNVGEVCAGGQEGIVTGNCTFNINGGSVFCAFAGASNADVYGGTELFIGKTGFPYVTETLYGGNDFGGQIMGTMVHETGNTSAGSIQKVKSNTYVEYNRGEIGYESGKAVSSGSVDYGIFAGAFGKYDYNDKIYKEGFVESGASLAKTKPILMSHLTITSEEKADGVDYAANSFLNISSQSTDSKDRVRRAYAGSEGQAGWEGVATTYKTYALLNARNLSDRGGSNYLTEHAYAGGDCSKSYYARMDVYAIHANEVFGGCRGMSNEVRTDTKSHAISYMSELSTVNVYPTLNNANLDIFGAGAYSGSKQTEVTLLGGLMNDVYGASLNEGVTYTSHINVPATSTAKVNALYGGGKGDSEENACDTYVAVIDYAPTSAQTYVNEAIYGGNNQYRFTLNSYLNISVPVRTSDADVMGDLFGGGHGAYTLSRLTRVNLTDGAQLEYVYGGGRDGKVYNMPSLMDYIHETDYFETTTGEGIPSSYAAATEPAGFTTWKTGKSVAGISLDAISLPAFSTSSTDDQITTQILLPTGVTVTGDVYGGGLGSYATVAGNTEIKLQGATVKGDLYGGGFGGNVANERNLASNLINIKTNVELIGGTVTNAYGGGYEGSVGSMTETITDGHVTARSFDTGNTYVTVGKSSNGATVSLTDGDPAIARSLFGGGEKGAVHGKATLVIQNGHVGYTYNTITGKYEENLDIDINEKDNLLEGNGNVFGGGFGEGATTLESDVTVWNGTIRNGLYGGGEIASIGIGRTIESTATRERVLDPLTAVTHGKSTVTMYRGNVYGDVFGGGRGYSYDLSGNELTGQVFYTDGYVFGSTAVYLHGGIIGTAENVEDGHGNVFGGGNVGFVYSEKGTKQTVDVVDKGVTVRKAGYYYDNSKEGNVLTEDTKVVVSPYAQVTADVMINGKTFNQFEYVPTEYMNYLLKTSSEWTNLDYEYGVTVHNAVFAGGNVSRGSDKLYANTTTVYGNSTASLVDVYNRDLITVGTEHTGGIYGDGNLTLVDGYREISISNYGTDYYNLETSISLEKYNSLNDRERAYFELKYKCVKAYDKYKIDDNISEEEYRKLAPTYQTTEYWVKAGFCSIYAGRLLNTVQRADFVGVFGSRIVLQGAEDRVVDQVDYTEYAINRVSELSLNRRDSKAPNEDSKNTPHGNYFGMYNIVNFLEAVTSDVNFTDKRTTDNTKYDDGGVLEDRSYYDYKMHHISGKYRNNGTALNKIALAKGVYLELVKETPTDGSTKEYGPITGVIELDLMDAQQDLGGAYVYAKNTHGVRSGSVLTQAILSEYNTGARTHKGYTYDSSNQGIQTSGNFVNSIKQIYDDCYPNNGDVTSPAHYWFLRGTIYEYDQYVSAYTGSSTAYKADVQIPLTISSGSNGKLKVIAVQPNLFAYYKAAGVKLGAGETKVINNITYSLNSPITYWAWSQLSSEERDLFVRETYVAINDFKLTADGTKTYAKKDVMLPSDLYQEGTTTLRTELYSVSKSQMVPASDVVRLSNAMNHTKGYALTADITNPQQWNDRYIRKKDVKKDGKWVKLVLTYDEYQAKVKDWDDKVKAGTMTDAVRLDSISKYLEGPSYYTDRTYVYGQRSYSVNDIITTDIYKYYEEEIKTKTGITLENQAEMDKAYISTKAVTYTYNSVKKNLQEGVAISKTEYDSIKSDATVANSFEQAYVCTQTVDDGINYYLSSTLVSKTVYDNMSSEIKSAFALAYICTKAGQYSGTYFEEGTNYNTLVAWCSLNPSDREHFHFNYDAFDLFITDLNPNSEISDYDDYPTRSIYYSDQLDIEYEATLKATATKSLDSHIDDNGDLNYKDQNGADVKIEKASPIKRSAFENVPNEKSHYIAVTIDKKADGASSTEDRYIIKESFTRGDYTYLPGSETDKVTYDAMTDEQKAKVGKYTFTKSTTEDLTYYFCNKGYTVNEKGEGQTVSVLNDAGGVVRSTAQSTITSGNAVPVGTIINPTNYSALPNLQYLFDISGKSPIETSTLYVSRDADIQDVQQDRIVTLIYQYQYDESSNDGTSVEQVTERHVVNIHISFKTGVPKIGELRMPGVVFPGATIGLRQPVVAEGAYEIIGGGWEIFQTEDDANNHENGTDYINNQTPMFYYQDGYYAAYYTKTYLGKTYSNAVRLTVANHHRMEDVMTSKHTEYADDGITILKENVHDYLYLSRAIDQMDVDKDKHAPKIYIDDHICADIRFSELDYLKAFVDSTNKASASDPYLGKVKGMNHLVFFLQGDVAPIYNAGNWTPLGTSETHFLADLHGDGHCVTGLNNSLFGYFDGNVWNLGVNGSFTGSGISDNSASGKKAVNCWAWTSDNIASKPVFGGAGTMTNCYYLAANSPSAPGVTKTTLAKMLNGDLAYRLNDYYLHKRYQDSKESSTSNTYHYWKEDNSGQLKLRTGNYTSASSDKYVEERYADKDFLYARGENPSTVDIRFSSGSYYPVYPDDYIFFGQKLSYGILGAEVEHDDHPTAAEKNVSNNRLTSDATLSNRVYRAPAYFGSKTANHIYLNRQAAFDDSYTYNTQDIDVHKGLTAVDLTGYNDKSYSDKDKDYTPMLDYDGLSSITTQGITANLLVYADPSTDDSYDQIVSALAEPALTEGSTYGTVSKAAFTPRGHLVDLTGNGYMATRNHCLVDNQDFNCPISYKFSGSYVMWYQRTPTVYGYMDGTNVSGWETVCLPFTTERVAAHQKGLLTHFYSTNTDSHEYWVRGLGAVNTEGKASFYLPSAVKGETGYDTRYASTSTYTIKNSFLWDYYYSKSSGKDANNDIYQTYYNSDRTFTNYPYLTAQVPYIISVPGSLFFEFDMSGTFVPSNAASTPDKLEKQVLTFKSVAQQTIAVSDDSKNYTEVKDSDNDPLVFRGTYQTRTLDTGKNFYAMDAAGSQFEWVGSDAVSVKPFRAYIDDVSGTKGGEIFIGFEPEDEEEEEVVELEIYSRNHTLYIENPAKEAVTVRVMNSIGMTLEVVTVQPGEKHERGPLSPGVYFVGNVKILVK